MLYKVIMVFYSDSRKKYVNNLCGLKVVSVNIEPEGTYSIYKKLVHIFSSFEYSLTLTLLSWNIWWATTNASNWQMWFNSAFKGLNWVKVQCSIRTFSKQEWRRHFAQPVTSFIIAKPRIFLKTSTTPSFLQLIDKCFLFFCSAWMYQVKFILSTFRLYGNYSILFESWLLLSHVSPSSLNPALCRKTLTNWDAVDTGLTHPRRQTWQHHSYNLKCLSQANEQVLKKERRCLRKQSKTNVRLGKKKGGGSRTGTNLEEGRTLTNDDPNK